MKRLYSIMLMFAFLIPFTIQADTISKPLYQMDVTHSAIDIGSGSADAIAMTSVIAANQESQSNIYDVSLFKPSETMITLTDCNSCHSNTATNSIGVLGGNSIGIIRFS